MEWNTQVQNGIHVLRQWVLNFVQQREVTDSTITCFIESEVKTHAKLYIDESPSQQSVANISNGHCLRIRRTKLNRDKPSPRQNNYNHNMVKSCFIITLIFRFWGGGLTETGELSDYQATRNNFDPTVSFSINNRNNPKAERLNKQS